MPLIIIISLFFFQFSLSLLHRGAQYTDGSVLSQFDRITAANEAMNFKKKNSAVIE